MDFIQNEPDDHARSSLHPRIPSFAQYSIHSKDVFQSLCKDIPVLSSCILVLYGVPRTLVGFVGVTRTRRVRTHESFERGIHESFERDFSLHLVFSKESLVRSVGSKDKRH